MRASHSIVGALAAVAALSSPGIALAQAGRGAPARAPARGPAAQPAAPVQCGPGEEPGAGHCCATGSHWLAPRRACVPQNPRQALVQVVLNNPGGALPDGLAVTLDGSAIPGTPPTISVAPGQHQLAVNAPGYRAIAQTLTLTAGQVQRLTMDLEATVGRVAITVNTPNAQVTLDGQPVSGSPPTADNVAPGPHTVVATAEGHEQVRRDVTVTAGQTATVALGDLPETPPATVVAPTPEPAAPPPAPHQTLTISVATGTTQSWDVEVVVGESQIFRCDVPVTTSAPCVLNDVPAGPALIRSTGSLGFTESVNVGHGASSVVIDFQPQAIGRIGYAVAGVLTLVPAAVAFGAAASCQSGTQQCNALPFVGLGLLAIPAVLPGAYFWYQVSQEHGDTHLTMTNAVPQGTSAMRVHRVFGNQRGRTTTTHSAPSPTSFATPLSF